MRVSATMLARTRMAIPPGKNVLTWICGARADRSSTFSRWPKSWAWFLLPNGLHWPSDSLPASSHPFSGFQTIGVAGQDRLPIEQGLIQLSRLFQQCRQLTSRQDIGGTNRQGILKPTESCDPFLARPRGPACWWFHRAVSFYRHAGTPVLFGPSG